MRPAAGSRRAFLTVVDQGFSSVSNFAVGVVVARAAGPSGLGGFAIAYGGWLMLAAMHRSLIAEPMAIEGDARSDSETAGVRRGLAAELVLGLAATAIFLLLGLGLRGARATVISSALLGLAPWLPLLVVQDYWRWVGFMRRQPQRSLANDAVFNAGQILAFAAMFVAHVHSVAVLIGAWGFGGGCGALYGLWQYRVRPTMRHGLDLLRARWPMSRWLASMSLTDWGAQQGYLIVVGAILGPAALGGLKAAQMLVAGPAGVLIQAGGSIGLPEASRAYSDQGWPGLMRVARVVTIAGFASLASVAVVVFVWGGKLLTVVYGNSFAGLHTASMLIAVGFLLVAFDLGPVLVLKATRHTLQVFFVEVVYMIASLTSVTVLSLMYGINGAAGAVIVTYAVTMTWARWQQHQVRVKTEPSELAVVPVPA